MEQVLHFTAKPNSIPSREASFKPFVSIISWLKGLLVVMGVVADLLISRKALKLSLLQRMSAVNFLQTQTFQENMAPHN